MNKSYGSGGAAAASEARNTLEVFGRVIRKARKGAKLNQSELSRLTGVGIATLSLIERGERDIRLSTIMRIAEVLDLRISLDAQASRRPPEPEVSRETELETEAYDLEALR